MARLHVRLTPKAANDGIDGWGEDGQGRRFLKIRVRAAPVEGRANAALLAFVADRLAVPKSKVRIVAGETARLKTLDVDVDQDRLDALA